MMPIGPFACDYLFYKNNFNVFGKDFMLIFFFMFFFWVMI